MKPDAQRIAIAEACGWIWVSDAQSFIHPEEGRVRNRYFPDYLNDRNAMHEAILTVFSSNTGHYERRFAMMVSSVVSREEGESFTEYAPDGLRDVCACIMADTRKLAEALLRVLERWEG